MGVHGRPVAFLPGVRKGPVPKGRSDWREKALWLKQCSVARRLADVGRVTMFPIPKRTPMVSLTRTGLPRVIPANHRKVIRSGSERSYEMIGVYPITFRIYQIIDCKRVMDTTSIIGEFDSIESRAQKVKSCETSQALHGA